MSQKIMRVLTIVIIGFLTLGILVGATYLYNKLVYTNPLEASVTKMSSIGSFKVEQFNSRSKITVQFNIREKLRANFYLLLDQLEYQSTKSMNSLTIEISNTPDEDLRTFLTMSRLPVFEAISTGKFTELPAQLDNICVNTPVKYELEIDNNFVFITACTKDASAHMAINREDTPLLIINTMGGEYL